MSIWENLVTPDSEGAESSNKHDLRSVSSLVKEESLQKVVDFIEKNSEKFSDLRVCPQATALVQGILREAIHGDSESLKGFVESKLTDNIEFEEGDLSEVAGPQVSSSDLSSGLRHLDDREFRESVKRVWGWIQRNHAVLTFLTVAIQEKFELDSRHQAETDIAPSMRHGLKYADEILCSYFSGFMRGYSKGKDRRESY